MPSGTTKVVTCLSSLWVVCPTLVSCQPSRIYATVLRSALFYYRRPLYPASVLVFDTRPPDQLTHFLGCTSEACKTAIEDGFTYKCSDTLHWSCGLTSSELIAEIHFEKEKDGGCGMSYAYCWYSVCAAYRRPVVGGLQPKNAPRWVMIPIALLLC